MSKHVEYHVQAQTGIGHKGKRAKPYPVYSLYQFARTHKEAIQIAMRRRKLVPQLGVRIIRLVRLATVTKSFPPNVEGLRS